MKQRMAVVLWLSALTWASIGLTGCGFFGGTGQVSGQVIVNGEPRGGFEVTFTSADHKNVFHGIVEEDGTFLLRRGRERATVPTGDYKITLAPIALSESVPAMDEDIIPAEYTTVERAKLTETVQKGSNYFLLDFFWDDTPPKRVRSTE